jgi:hypothetical protein
VAVPGFDAGDRFPTGSYKISVERESPTITFAPDGSIVLKNGRQVKIEGRYTINGDQVLIKMKEKRGETEMACEGEGRYRWGFNGKAIRLTKMADDCLGRVFALTAGPLPLVEGTK